MRCRSLGGFVSCVLARMSRATKFMPINLPPKNSKPRLAVIGGGLAGLAAAAAAVEHDWQVDLFERCPKLGGRAGSFVDHATGETVDFCQHVGMGCCTELLDFLRQTGAADCFERDKTLRFIASDGRRSDFSPSQWLPAPLHLLPGLRRLSFLSWRDRGRIARTLTKLVRLDESVAGDVGSWLRAEHQSPEAIERFWGVVLVSALSETVERASLSAARKVFRDGFWTLRGGSDLLLPKVPLVEIFHDRVGRWLRDRGVGVHCGVEVRDIQDDGRRAVSLLLADGSMFAFDACVLAVPWRQKLVDSGRWSAASARNLKSAAITSVHFWFDRPITDLSHAAIVGKTSQWLFAKPWGEGQYCQVVVSASHRLVHRTREEWLAVIRGELQELWPAACRAKLVHARVVTHPTAVFSVTPEASLDRPSAETSLENVFLAGDWTATGWPATMEGAIRSGRNAVASLLRVKTP